MKIFFVTALISVKAFASVLSGVDITSGDQKTIDVSLSKKATVVVFLSSKCPCSTSHEQTLDALQKEFSSKGFNFIGVHSNVDEDQDLTREHFRKSGLSFPVIQDERSKLADRFGAVKTPHVYILDPDDKILFQGGVDDSHDASLSKKHFLKEALVALNDGKSPPEKEVRTLGCFIAR